MWFLSVFSATDCVELLNGYCCVFFKVTVAVSPCKSAIACWWWIVESAISAAVSVALEIPFSMWLKLVAFCGVPC